MKIFTAHIRSPHDEHKPLCGGYDNHRDNNNRRINNNLLLLPQFIPFPEEESWNMGTKHGHTWLKCKECTALITPLEMLANTDL